MNKSDRNRAETNQKTGRIFARSPLTPDTPSLHRAESFGGIAAFENPPRLVFGDHDWYRSFAESAEKPQGPLLSAPTEVHFSITSRCSNGCSHCYQDSGSGREGRLPADLPFEKVDSILQELARLKVFHIALGGGESVEHPKLFDIAKRVRELKMVPNLTVSGAGIDSSNAHKFNLFGQVNVSLDPPSDRPFRSAESRLTALSALKALVGAGVPAGINAVIGRDSYEGIPDLFREAKAVGASEIEFLRLKPAGRAIQDYEKLKMSAVQNRRVVPRLMRWSRKTGVTARMDCSLVPMLCWHRPSVPMLKRCGVYGCEPGHLLLGIDSMGRVSGCSFLSGEQDALALLKQWETRRPEIQQHPRKGEADFAEPCRSCRWLSVCRGGCQAVSLAAGNRNAPDPDCPYVVRYLKKRRRHV